MDSRPLHYRSLVATAQALQAGEITAQALTRTMLDRVSDLDPQFHAFTHLCGERALERAEAADQALGQGIVQGGMHGVPIAVKDLCRTSFAPTTAGMAIHDGLMSDNNATVVDRLEAAGAIILGKLTMTEGAYIGHHPSVSVPQNPLGAQYWVGSSSSGSGVATAAGFCFGALGSDTGGSIRFPCATCGLTGLKPTWGRVSRSGVFDLAPTLDHVGPITRSAADCAAMLSAIAGFDPLDPTSSDVAVPDYMAGIEAPVRGIRIGIDRAYALEDVDPDVAGALESALDVFDSLGARIVDVKMPAYADLVASWVMMCAVETALVHEATYPARAEEYGPALAGLIDLGRGASGLDVARGNMLRATFSAALQTLFRDIDCLLCPTMPAPVPTLAELEAFAADPDLMTAILRYTAPFDFSGSPTLTLPNGVDARGMPASMQIVGPAFSEAMVLRVGAAYQRATNWHCQHPSLD